MGDGPSDVAVSDVSGDANLDAATTNVLGVGPNVGTTITVLPGTGASFGASSTLAVGRAPRGIAAGDFDSNGTADLAVSNSNDASLTLYFQANNGALGNRTDLASGTAPDGVLAADLNGDGRVDLAVANPFSDTISVLQGQGGSFQAPEAFATDQGPLDLVAADAMRASQPASTDLVERQVQGAFSPSARPQVPCSVSAASWRPSAPISGGRWRRPGSSSPATSASATSPPAPPRGSCWP